MSTRKSIIGTFLSLSGYPVPYVFLSDEARTLGFSSEASANLLVYTVGRVVAGKNFHFIFVSKGRENLLNVENFQLGTHGRKQE